MASIKTWFFCFYQALVDTIEHDGVEHAGYLSFLALLSFFPFLVFLVAFTGFIGQSDIGERFVEVFLSSIPEEVMVALKPRILEIVSGPPQSLLTIAIIGTIWTASSAVEGMRTILNRAYRVSTPPSYIWRRLLSIGQFLILTIVLMVTMSLLIIVPMIWSFLSPYFSLEQISIFQETKDYSLHYVVFALRYVASALVLLLIVTTFYIIVPNIKMRISAVLPGAIIVVGAWMAAGSAVSFYVSHSEQVNIVYGSLGGVILTLLFFYVMSMIFIYGAEFNYRIEQARGHKIEEKEPAENIGP